MWKDWTQTRNIVVSWFYLEPDPGISPLKSLFPLFFEALQSAGQKFRLWKVLEILIEDLYFKSFQFYLIFACDSIYAIAHICYRPSVRPSVCLSVPLSVTRVDQSKTVVEVRIMQLSPPGSPMTLVSSRLTSLRNSKGNLGSEGAK